MLVMPDAVEKLKKFVPKSEIKSAPLRLKNVSWSCPPPPSIVSVPPKVVPWVTTKLVLPSPPVNTSSPVVNIKFSTNVAVVPADRPTSISSSAKTSWIADIKNENGKTSGPSPNRKGDYKYPCPKSERANLTKILKELKMI